MEICVLASGSKGNSIYVSGGGTALLVDAGLSARELATRLRVAGIAPDSLHALLITHDHEDHFRGVEAFTRKFPLRLFANEGTVSGIEVRCPGMMCQWEIFETASAFEIGSLRVEAFTVPHDAADPVGFVFDDGAARLCVVTDLGMATSLVAAKLAQCHVAILESNHDAAMLMHSDRPWSLKMRIAGRSGHLSNDDAAELAAASIPSQMHTLFLAHLSEVCNTPDLALGTMRRALRAAGRADVRVEALSQSRVSGVLAF